MKVLAAALLLLAGTAQAQTTINAATQLRNQVPIANGGTNSATAAGALLNLGAMAAPSTPFSTPGDFAVFNGSTVVRFAGNTSGVKCYQQDGSGTSLWGACGTGGTFTISGPGVAATNSAGTVTPTGLTTLSFVLNDTVSFDAPTFTNQTPGGNALLIGGTGTGVNGGNAVLQGGIGVGHPGGWIQANGGVTVGSASGTLPTGGNPGDGWVNASSGYKVNNVALPTLTSVNAWLARNTFLAGLSSNWDVNYGAGNTSGEAFMPFQSSQNPTGICNPDGAGNCVYNRIIIGSDNVDSSSGVNGTIAFQINENCCLTSAKGTRNVGQFIINVIGTPADAAGNHSYVALETTGRVAVNLGGTSTSAIANTSGSVFGANPYVSLASGATDLRGVIGQETDVEMATGSSAWAAVGQSVIATVNWTVKAAQENVGYEVASQSNSIHPFDVAYQIGGYEGWPGIDTAGGIMRCEFNQASGQCPGIGYGIDFSNIASMSGFAFAGPNAAFNVTGPGALTATKVTNGGALVENSIVTTTTSAPAAATTRYERCNSGSALSITFATTGMVIGQRIDVKNVNTGVCTVDSGSGHTIDGAQTFTLSTQYQNVSLLCTAVTSGTCTAWDVE